MSTASILETMIEDEASTRETIVGSEDGDFTSQYVLESQHTTHTALEIPEVTTLPELFQWQARHRGDATLFSFRGHPESALTIVSYSQAYKTAVHLANVLHDLQRSTRRSTGSGGPPVFGILMEKSVELHLAILATTIAGATWLPFDADAPAARVAACLKDSSASMLICDAVHEVSAEEAVKGLVECQVVPWTELCDRQSADEPPAELPGPEPHHTAYMIYTSGSTGTPKGIEIPHSAALAFCLSERSVLETGPEDVVWQGFSPAFDMFIEEVWISIAGGAHLAIGSRAECQDVPGLGGAAGVWAQRGVTLVNAVPTLINIMTSLDDDCSLPPRIRLLNLGGEACPAALVKRLWHPELRIINTYGPSETTVTATFQELFPGEVVTIGKPLPMYHALLLPILDDPDEANPWSPMRLEEGAEGELAIGGKCLGKGYVGLEALTKQKFIQHPIHQDERLYRTGDRVRLDMNLNLIFLGRIDSQVKHRGFRIELGEIESAIAAHPMVQTAAVILSTSTQQLEAYVVGKDGSVEIKDLRGQFASLPAYMHPEGYFFISADEMPRLASGKINLKALQDVSARFAEQTKQLEHDKMDERDHGAATMSSDDSNLDVLLGAMRTVFPQAVDVLATSDFFDDLGGHSLAAAVLVSKLRKDSPEGSPLRRIGLKDIYTYRTAEGISASLDVSDDDDTTLNEEDPAHDAHVGDYWPVSRWSYALCGMAQVPPLLFFFFLQSISFLAPYLIFHFVLIYKGDLVLAIVATYVTFVATALLFTLVGIVGKWVVLGRAKPGEYPLYGLYYYRWWLAQHFVELVDMTGVADTALMPALMRCLGATVGVHCHIGVTNIGAAFDLVSIGDDVVIGKDIVLDTSWVERGRLILSPVTIGSQAHIGSNSVLEGGSSVQQAGELGPMTMLPSGQTVPAGERWHGSPARFQKCAPNNSNPSRPSLWRTSLMALATSLTSVFVMPILSFAPQIPSILLFEYVQIPGVWSWAQTAIVSVPSAILYIFLVFLELFVLRWVVLGRVRECSYRTTSIYYFRKWFVDRIMDLGLVILHPVYATLYVVPFLSSLGVKIGRMAEVSTARGINFELTEIGDESFVADGVLLGDGEIRDNMVTLKKTKLNPRAFAGNASLIPQGTELASNTLVGVLSIAPNLQEGQSCFGSPPVLMPARQQGSTTHASHLLYTPRWTQIALRLFIEGMRIIVPRVLIVFALGYGVQLFELAFPYINILPTILLLPLFYFFLFALPALIITILCKWILIGSYQRAEWPLWSVDVWKSEFVTSMYETLAAPILVGMLTGTPFLAWVLRLLGTQIGSRTTLLSHDITEFDMVSLGDEAVINRHAGPQTHLFEDRVMKVGRGDIEARGCMKAYSIILPNSRIGAGAQLGCLSLVMKGETVPAGEAWEGAPIAPRTRRHPTQYDSEKAATEGSETPLSHGSTLAVNKRAGMILPDVSEGWDGDEWEDIKRKIMNMQLP